MPLSPFRTRKLEKMFASLDLDGDGFVEQNDFTHRVRVVARLRGWEAGSDPYVRHMRTALEEWMNLRESADADDDSRVTRDEFLRFAEVFFDDPEAVRAYARGDVQLLFDAMDTDGDGKVTREEYRAYLQVCGADASAADGFFAHADRNEDDRISRDEMSRAVEQFLASEDPAAGGNFLFGPLD